MNLEENRELHYSKKSALIFQHYSNCIKNQKCRPHLPKNRNNTQIPT